jgi:hypothetical protein
MRGDGMKDYKPPAVPNPEIYRHAAELLADGTHAFTCKAIQTAISLADEKFSIGDLYFYIAQFSAGFEPHRAPKVIAHGQISARAAYAIGSKDCGEHAFWNKNSTPAGREHRIMSLLLMADMCEQGN